MFNPLDYTYNWTAIGWGATAALTYVGGHLKVLPRLGSKIITALTPEAVKVKAEMEAIKAKLETQNTKDIQDLKTEVAALKAKLPQ